MKADAPSVTIALGLSLVLGFLSMGFQLVASRLLAPHFGTALIVWAFLISTFLAAFSAGAFLGGIVSRLHPIHRSKALRWQALIGVSFFAVVAFAGRPLLREIESLFLDISLGLLVACLLLFFIPVATLSGMLPVLTEMLAKKGSNTGTASGFVYGVSTFGNIAGVMVTAFILIPNFSTPELLIGWFVLSFACLMASVLVLAR